jgi:hypothetical protein
MQVTVQQACRMRDGVPVHYERHGPEQTTLHRLVLLSSVRTRSPARSNTS